MPRPAPDAAPSSLAAVPGWLGSAAMHATLLAILLTTGVPSCGSLGDAAGDPGGDFRQVGLVFKDAAARERANQDSEVEQDAALAHSTVAPSVEPPSELDQTPPVPILVPSAGPPLVGPGGSAPPAASAPDVRDLVKPTGTPRAGGTQEVGPGEVQFFGAKDRASQVVYVLDCSGSMSGAPLAEAKARLVASLESLDSTQRFQIIFYNQSPSIMTLRGEQRPELYWATDINRTLARQFIASVDANLGTDHMPALLQALSLKPEVLYLLTDADQPQLSARELNRIRSTNAGRTRIHTIEFGEGSQGSRRLDPTSGNFLEVLAEQNGGTYRYQDVGAFRARR
ncbi:MAG TPA: hypothetical protein VML55_08745 [Planctomycetaceae bacterium]|nr:hypothetical protein [Planctomycetaceae bacterium]